MSEKTEVDQEYDDEDASPASVNLPEHQYTRDELYDLARSPESKRRPKCLEKKFDTEDGWWDPERWYKAKFVSSREASPLTLTETKERRRGLPDLDVKRRPSVDSVGRLKERDGINLSPQRRSFGTGCHVQNPPSYVRQLSIPERDEAKADRERGGDRDRERERPIRKIGSGRLQLDKEGGTYTSHRDRDRDRFDERDVRDRDRERDVRDPRDRDFAWNRDRNDRGDRDRDWDRDRDLRGDRDRDRDVRDHRDDWDRDRERRFDRSDRFRRPGDRDFPDRGDRQRDREFHNRGYDKHSRRRNHHEEKEPEWFTGGPTSQLETIELRGFEKEGDHDMEEGVSLRPNAQRQELRKRRTPPNQKSFKDSSEEVSEADVKASQRSSPEEDQQVQVGSDKGPGRLKAASQQQQQQSNSGQAHSVSDNKGFDIDHILNSVPLPEALEGEGQKVSRFSRFFSARGTNQTEEDSTAAMEANFGQNLAEERRTSPAVSPVAAAAYAQEQQQQQHPHHHLLQHQHGMPAHHLYQQHHQAFLEHHQHVAQQLHQHQQQQHHHGLPPELQQHQMQHGHMSSMNVPTSAGDNARSSSSASCGGKPDDNNGGGPLSASVTALFNAAAASSAAGGSSSAGPISSGSSFSTQDASAQLKAMLFGGANKESAPSSGTASPASLPPGVHHKVKTLAELEADMHQNSTPAAPAGATNGGAPTAPADTRKDSGVGHEGGSGDMTAFNKLLFMVDNASVTPSEPQGPRTGYSLLPSHSQFLNAVQKNKEEQKLLQQQSLQNVMGPPPLPLQHMGQPPPPPHAISAAALQQMQMQQSGFPPPGMPMQAQVQQRMAKPFSMTPQAMSTPAASSQARPHSSQCSSTDPILSLIQQNPSIVMKPASPAMSVASLLASQQHQQMQQAGLVKAGRGPSPGDHFWAEKSSASPIMFSQQPPQHLSAPSPIRTGHLSPGSMMVGDNNMPANAPPGGGAPTSPVLHGEMTAQAAIQNNIIKKQLQDGANSPSQLQVKVVKPQPAAQQVLPPNPQPKGSSVNTFTPTSVLRKMHNDKALVKERQAQEGRSEEDMEFMPSMRELGGSQGSSELLGLQHRPASADDILTNNNNGTTNHHHHHFDQHHQHDLSDISFLDPVNPDLVAMTSHMESQLRIGAGYSGGGQSLVLPGTLSHPMSVEEKMKLSALAEKPGYLSQMLDKSKAAAEARLRPIVKAGSEVNFEERNLLQQQQQNHMLQQQQQQQQQQLAGGLGGRPVTGCGVNLQQQQQMFQAGPPPPPPQHQPQGLPQQLQQASSKGGGSGRAIVGNSSVQPQQQQQGAEMMRMLEQQQHMHHYMQQGMVLPPPPMGGPMAFPGPPPVGIPIAMPVSGQAGGRGMPGLVSGQMLAASQQGRMALMHQQQQQQLAARANAMNTQQRHQHQMFMAMQQQQQQQQRMGPLHAVVPSVGQAGTGPLSPAALSATIQRVASPHLSGINGPMSMGPGMNGASQQQTAAAGKVDLGSGIQRWFSPDILKTQLPSMPPLPTQGNKVMTVDELERA